MKTSLQCPQESILEAVAAPHIKGDLSLFALSD